MLCNAAGGGATYMTEDVLGGDDADEVGEMGPDVGRDPGNA